MRKKILITFTYALYLALLGQGCSVLKGDVSSLTLELPRVEIPKPISIPSLPEVRTTQVIASLPSQVVESSTDGSSRKTPAPSKDFKVVKKTEKVEPYRPSSYRVSTQSNSNIASIKERPIEKIEIPRVVKKTIIIPKVTNEVLNKKTKEESVTTKIEDLSDLKKTSEKEKYLLSLDPGFEHYGFQVSFGESRFETSWMNKIKDNLERRLERVANESKNTIKESKATVASTDLPTIGTFVNDENDYSDIIKKTDSSIVKKDEMVFLDYSKNNKPTQLEKTKSSDVLPPTSLKVGTLISSSVRQVIDREMSSGDSPKTDMKNLLAMASPVRNNGQSKKSSTYRDIIKEDSRAKSKTIGNQATLYAIESDLKDGFRNEVTNFDFIPSHNSNKSLRDFNEGSIEIDYSLMNQTGLLRGTILKNYYMRTSFEIPLGSEYSKFEIPLIPKDSLGTYLDDNNLDGYGGFFLVDLGDLIEDVDIEKTSNDKNAPYEHRLLLDDDFKPVKTGSEYRYVLFIGVVPGSINVRYLGVNGQEASKLTFITPDEVSYDFSQIERPHLLNFRTKVRNTLGMSTSSIDLSIDSITSFMDETHPTKISESNYEIKVPWSIKGMRNYFRFDYLADDIFVGMDRDQEVELPSKEFIGEILRSFNMDSLGGECILQLNFSSPVSEIEIQAESDKGPANFDHTYLDRDGVFSPEISPLSQKYFAIGYEEGIFSIKISYENGESDYMRTYCSPSTYLLEQL